MTKLGYKKVVMFACVAGIVAAAILFVVRPMLGA